jgi:hypothetical protein
MFSRPMKARGQRFYHAYYGIEIKFDYRISIGYLIQRINSKRFFLGQSIVNATDTNEKESES